MEAETVGGAAAETVGGAAAETVGAAGGATDSFGSPMTAITVPTATVASAGTLISRSVPAAGDGTSVSTLSVAISTSGS